MIRRALAAVLLLAGVGTANAQQLVVGPLQAQNLLSEIAKQGAAAQAVAQFNLGLSGGGGGSQTGQFKTIVLTDTNKNTLNFLPWSKSGLPATTAQTDSNVDLTMTGGTAGNTFANLREYSIIRGAPNINIWSQLGVVDYVGTGGTGQHVGGYFQDIRRAAPAAGGPSNNPQLWAVVGESIDMTGAPSSQSNAQLSAEWDLRGGGVDDASQRQGMVQVLSTYGSLSPMEASRAYGTYTDALSQYKFILQPSGNYQTAAIDTRNATDNGFSSGSRPTVTSTVTGTSVPVSNVMPFTSDRFGRDLNYGAGAYNTPITINGVTYTQTGYTITGNGPAGTVIVSAAVGTDGTSGNTVRNGSHTLWLGTGQDIALDTGGLNTISYDSTLNSISFYQSGTKFLRGNSAGIAALVPVQFKAYTVATLPAASQPGQTVWVTDCRNGTEGVGFGTGCLYATNNANTWVANPSTDPRAITVGGQVIAFGGSTTNQGTGPKLQLSTGTVVNGHCAQFDVNGNVIDAGAACGGGGAGSGTVSTGAVNALAYYSAAGTTVAATNTLANGVLVTNGSSVPSISNTLPSGVNLSSPSITGASLLGTTTGVGKINTAASSTSAAGLNLGQGVAPTSPVNGDLWMTAAAGLQYRNGGTTLTPITSVTVSSPIVLTGAGTAAIALTCPTCVAGLQPGAALVQWPTNVAVSNDTYYYALSWPWTNGTITSIKYATSGTGTPSFSASVQVAGASVTGCSGITVNSATVTTATCTAANTITAGQKVTLVVTGVSGVPNAAQVQINYTRSAS